MSGPVTLKIGGRLAEQNELLRSLAEEIRAAGTKQSFILVHGGGVEVSRICRELGHEPEFRDGIRMTSPEEMPAVEMILAGRVNKRLVRTFQGCGLNSVGLCGADGRTFVGSRMQESRPGKEAGQTIQARTGAGDSSRTGTVERVDPSLLKILLAGGYFPVVASTSMDEAGEGLNINADTVAFEIARAVQSSRLIFLSDIPGILKGGSLLSSLHEEQIREEVENGTISGGMIPKVDSSLEALKAGVGGIIIGQYQGPGDLAALLQGRSGTRISL